MKKLLFTLLMGMAILPTQVFADHYEFDELTSLPSFPIKAPAKYRVAFDLNYNTGNFVICPNYDLSGLNVTIVRNGITYLNTTVSLTAGQVYLDSFAGFEEGAYTLTLSTSNGVISQYQITVIAE